MNPPSDESDGPTYTPELESESDSPTYTPGPEDGSDSPTYTPGSEEESDDSTYTPGPEDLMETSSDEEDYSHTHVRPLGLGRILVVLSDDEEPEDDQRSDIGMIVGSPEIEVIDLVTDDEEDM